MGRAEPEYHFPALTGRVVDRAHLLRPRDRAAIAAQGAALERKTGHELVVVTVENLRGHNIEEYGRRLGNYWGIGRRKYDDGVLLIVAPRERKVRIEVGCGLERDVRDDEAAAIIRVMLPAFKSGRMAAGIHTGVDEIIRELSPAMKKAA